jgi:hypothetical protein
MELKGSLPCSQKPITGPFPQPDEFSPHPQNLVLLDPFNGHIFLGLPSGLLPSGCLTKMIYAFFISPVQAMCPICLTFISLIILIMFGEEYRYEPSHYAAFSSLPLLPLSWVQVYSSAPCSQIPSVSKSFKTMGKISYMYLYLYIFRQETGKQF